MKIVIDIPNPPTVQTIINIPLHFCGGKVVEAGGYGFEERKTGRWINAYPDIEPNPMFAFSICSICGFEQSFWHRLNRCPHCGAEMEGAEEV